MAEQIEWEVIVIAYPTNDEEFWTRQEQAELSLKIGKRLRFVNKAKGDITEDIGQHPTRPKE